MLGEAQAAPVGFVLHLGEALGVMLSVSCDVSGRAAEGAAVQIGDALGVAVGGWSLGRRWDLRLAKSLVAL